MMRNSHEICQSGPTKPLQFHSDTLKPQKLNRPKFLCIHGYGTSGDILFRQMSAFRFHISDLEYIYVTSPQRLQGTPDPGIAQYYKNFPYFQWSEEGPTNGIQEQIGFLFDVIQQLNQPIDGLLGFSQGAMMATRLFYEIQLLRNKTLNNEPLTSIERANFEATKYIKSAILIGGVAPKGIEFPIVNPPEPVIFLPSLHLHGLADPFLPRSKHLEGLYSLSPPSSYPSSSSIPSTSLDYRVTLTHSEAHNIPSIRTGLYPQIREWIQGIYNNKKEEEMEEMTTSITTLTSDSQPIGTPLMDSLVTKSLNEMK